MGAWLVGREFGSHSTSRKIAGTIRGTKPPKSNMTTEDRKTLTELQKEKSITILPADKGKATFVVDAKERGDKVKGLLCVEKI